MCFRHLCPARHLRRDRPVSGTQGGRGGRPLATIIPGKRLVLTVAESGELLGISRAFAYELVVRGERPVIRLGRRIVVPKAAVLAYATGVQRLAGATQSGESVPMENMTDELCSMTVVPVAVGVTAHDPVARFVPLS